MSTQTMGVVGYGDIGKACGSLAKAYGMRVLALRRDPSKCEGDPIVDMAYGSGQVGDMLAECDYVLVAAPLTEKTRGMVGREELGRVKDGAVLINVGRGPIVDEQALIDNLKPGGRLAGAALDVFDVEPLPKENELWELPNVLVSSHNMDMTETFMLKSSEKFVELLEGWVRGDDGVGNEVDKAEGY